MASLAPTLTRRHLRALPFGAHSHWLQPWRAYQETLPAQRFLDSQSVVLERPETAAADLLVMMLARHGVRHVRIEIGWGSLNFWNEAQLNDAERLKAVFGACRTHGIRPLILLNANSGVPGPTDFSERTLGRAAKKGERRIQLTDVRDLNSRLQRARQPERLPGPARAIMTAIEDHDIVSLEAAAEGIWAKRVPGSPSPPCVTGRFRRLGVRTTAIRMAGWKRLCQHRGGFRLGDARVEARG